MDAFLNLYLFPSEYVLVEVKLDLLIGNVDAELLERVPLEVLKAEDVQDADVQALVILSGGDRNEKSVHLHAFFYLKCTGFVIFVQCPLQYGIIPTSPKQYTGKYQFRYQ